MPKELDVEIEQNPTKEITHSLSKGKKVADVVGGRHASE